MAYTPKILCFAGSLRRDSFNKKLVKIAMAGAKDAGADVTYLDLKEIPLPVFDEDLEKAEGIPENAKKLKQLMKSHQGFLLSCPEYNSSITGALKNAIDWASTPAPDEKPLECFDGKVAGLMAASPGGLGGLRGLVTVRSILGNISVHVIPQQVAIPNAGQAFAEDGSLKDQKKQQEVRNIGARLAEVTSRLFEPK
jgi:chromate reductase, NAD(P)H dehydrogenase (quinone)